MYIHLRAKNVERNVFREYVIYLSKSLFGDYLVNIIYGRIGSKGHQLVYAYANKRDAQKHVDMALRKRLNSTSRIGCNYEIM